MEQKKELLANIKVENKKLVERNMGLEYEITEEQKKLEIDDVARVKKQQAELEKKHTKALKRSQASFGKQSQNFNE